MAQQVVWDEAISFPSNAQTGTPQFWVSLTARVRDQAGSSRGKQYELDGQQAGQYGPTLINQDAALLPGNTSSPWSPNVGLRRPYRKRFQYPATVNMLTIDQATGGSTQAAGQRVDGAVPVWLSYQFFWNIVAENDAFTGPNVFQQVITSAQPPNTALADMDGWTVMPGVAHSAQCVMRATAGGTTPQVRLALLWRDVFGNTLSFATGSTVTLTANSRTWQQLTVSGTAPTNAAGGTLQIDIMNSVTATIEASGFQVEYAASPSSWVQPGVWGGVINGWTDRLPQRYSLQGTYATVTPNIVDTFARFSQIFPQPAFYADVLALGPDFFFPLNDPNGSTIFADLTGKHNAALTQVSQYGAGAVNAGQGIQSATAAGTFLGAPGPVVTVANASDNGTNQNPCSFISLTSGSGITGPPTSGAWTRMVAFRSSSSSYATGGQEGVVWNVGVGTWQTGFGHTPRWSVTVGAGINAGVIVAWSSTSGSGFWQSTSGAFADNNWHLLVFTMSADGLTTNIYVDGALQQNNVGFVDTHPGTLTIIDTIGIQYLPGANSYNDPYIGDVAHAAQFPIALSSTQVANLYTSWRSAWQGDSSGARYSRILGWANYPGRTAIDTGATSDMGPATDVDGKTDLFTLLQNVVTTETGNHYINSQGTVVFEARTRRYNQLTPTWTFGANTAAGELPFADLGFDYDLDHVANVAAVTQLSTGQVFTVSNAASQTAYDTLSLQRTLNVTNPQECIDAANYLANRYDQPQVRIDSITLNPSRTPALWAVLAVLDISARVRVNMRGVGPPTATPLVQFDGFVESIDWTVDAETGDHLAVLQVSPADLNIYWVLSALHTTSAATASSGQPSVTLNPLPDASVNPFTASVCSGLALTLEPGTANAETLTVLSVAGGIPMAPNGAFQVDTSSWGGSHSSTVAQETTTSVPANVPQTAALVTATQNTQPSGIAMAASASGFVAGTTYRFETWVNPSQTLTFTTNIDWFTSGGTFLSTTTVTVSNVAGGQWTKLTGTHLAPATAARAAAYVLCGTVAIGVSFQITAIWVGTSPVVTFTANLANTHASGSVVCEQLPAGTTDPTTWDAASLLGVSTTLAY